MTRTMPDERAEQTRTQLKQFMAARPDVTFEQLAMYTNLAPSTLRNFNAGHCPGGAVVVTEIDRMLLLARAGDILAPEARGAQALTVMEEHKPVRRVARRGNFYDIETVRRITEVLDYCAEHASIGIVTADYGCGKTEAVRYWRRTRGQETETLIFEFDEFTSSNKVEFVGVLARMLGAPVAVGSQNAARVFRELIDHLRAHPCLLVFDQCEVVRPRIFQVIRQIWDRASDVGVGVVILAAPMLLTRMMRSGMQDMGALSSRVGIWAALSGVGRAEMAAIVKQEGIDDVEGAAFDLWWKATGGSMRRLMRSIDLLKARHAGKRVTEKTIVGVAGHLWGMAIPGMA